MKKLGWTLMLVVLGAMIALYVLSNVPMTLNDASFEAAGKIRLETGILPFSPAGERSFVQEFQKLQDAIAYFHRMTLDSKQTGIPQGLSRELDDWYASKPGLCSDVSRAAELFLVSLGFQVRHVSIYTLKHNPRPFSVAMTYRNPSHAVAEVLTSRGWMLFDPNVGRIYVDAQGNPISVVAIHDAVKNGEVPADGAHVIFHDPYFVVYGLYSRHGLFYPPYIPVPDVAWADFLRYGCCEVVR